ncbi:MAG: LysR family transcriptional regulator [Deltaproteobacteria bacterium]|nr:LysR family transcriptional regulator [Deltaproteobacteria bacterium]
MDMRQVRHLISVIEHGNIVRAAKAIHISQPALTKSIQNLESELGVKLLERTPRGVTPTIYGDVLFKRARLLLNENEQAIEEIRAIKDGHLGHLRLGVANFAIHFLPAVVARLLLAKPGLTFEIVDGTYEALTALVREGTLDAVISGLPPFGQAPDLVHEELISTEFVIACGPGGPPLDHMLLSEASPRAMGDAQWILPNRPKVISDLWELGFRSAGATPPTPALQSGSYVFIKAMLLEGPFVTILPRGVVQREIDNGTLVATRIDDSFARTKEGIIYRPSGVQPPALHALIAAIRAEHDRIAADARSGDNPRAVTKSRVQPH